MDRQLLFLINREWTCAPLDWFMAALSCLAAWLPWLIVAGLALLVLGNFRARAFVVTLLVVVAINDGIVSNSLKHLVDRPRPHQSHNAVRVVDLAKAKPRMLALFRPVKVKFSQVDFGDIAGRSFPSSHTVNVCSAALVAACFYGRRAWWAFVLAGLVSYSRIYTGSHWPSDVLTSAFLGFGATLLWLAIVEWLWRTRAAHWLPRLHSAHPSLLAA